MANPLDKFELGIRKPIENLMIERMSENGKIVTHYMADQDFQSSAFPILAREIFEAVRGRLAGQDTTDRTRSGNAEVAIGGRRGGFGIVAKPSNAVAKRMAKRAAQGDAD